MLNQPHTETPATVPATAIALELSAVLLELGAAAAVAHTAADEMERKAAEAQAKLAGYFGTTMARVLVGKLIEPHIRCQGCGRPTPKDESYDGRCAECDVADGAPE